jgi:SIR2-like domain
MDFVEILPHLATFFSRGTLAPFIGSGMSRPACASWTELIQKLAQAAGISVPGDLSTTAVPSTTMYRLADQIVSALRPLSEQGRRLMYKKALCAWNGAGPAQVPEQTKALACLDWPLVLTTNYDDLYWSATRAKARPEILGRQLEDCHRVLRSLDGNAPPILWALQGFVGGQAVKEEVVVQDSRRRLDLANQIVLGHQQYQRAINADVHFRRAFAEVFRRKSLFFLGSGVLEDYLVNLFSEIIHHHGPGPYPHFALLSQQERDRFDPWFLQTRLGITPIFYESHDHLPGYLNDLATALQPVRPLASGCGAARIGQIVYCLPQQEASTPSELTMAICNSEISLPAGEGECAVVSVGRWENTPLEGKMARAIVGQAMASNSHASHRGWLPLDAQPSYVFRYDSAPLFAVAARRRDLSGPRHDLRDLGIIPEALSTALEKIDLLGFKTVHLGALASGRDAPWHPVHPFSQMLRGIRRFALIAGRKNLQRIDVHLVDPAVWQPFLANRIPVLELLSSDLVTYRLESRDAGGGVESFFVTLRESPCLGDLLAFCKIDRRQWIVKILPSATGEESGEPGDDSVIAPTMMVLLAPRS